MIRRAIQQRQLAFAYKTSVRPALNHNQIANVMLNISKVDKGTIFMENNKFYQVTSMNHNQRGRGGAIISMDSEELLTGKSYNKRLKHTDSLDVAEVDNVNTKFVDYEDGVFILQDDYENEFRIEDDRVWRSDYKLVAKGMPVRLLTYENDDGEVVPLTATISDDNSIVLKVNNISTYSDLCRAEVGLFDLQVKVPAHIKKGDYIRLSIQGNYLERAEDVEGEEEEE